jgi:DNA (cytosine-5)-methyltransferase 1
MGYHQAGFDVVGVDIRPQRHFPFEFHQGDAIEFIREHGHEFDVIHTSPPCQHYSHAQRIMGNEHDELIEPTREALQVAGRPFIIENVVGAPLLDPVMLCGAMFGLRTYRHRLFEVGNGLTLTQLDHPEHVAPVAKMGRRVQPGEYMHIVGNFIGADEGREVMGMPWASRRELAQAIPPAYTKYIGDAAMAALPGRGLGLAA